MNDGPGVIVFFDFIVVAGLASEGYQSPTCFCPAFLHSCILAFFFPSETHISRVDLDSSLISKSNDVLLKFMECKLV